MKVHIVLIQMQLAMVCKGNDCISRWLYDGSSRRTNKYLVSVKIEQVEYVISTHMKVKKTFHGRQLTQFKRFSLFKKNLDFDHWLKWDYLFFVSGKIALLDTCPMYVHTWFQDFRPIRKKISIFLINLNIFFGHSWVK